jgi:hypothetical protein
MRQPAVGLDGRTVLFRAVTFMDFKAIGWDFGSQADHQAVTHDLGHDGCRTDCGFRCVTTDDSAARKCNAGRDIATVNDHAVGCDGQAEHSPAHGFQRGTPDVQAIYVCR